MEARDVTSYDVAQLLIMGAKIQQSLDDLNKTIARSEADLIYNAQLIEQRITNLTLSMFNKIHPIINSMPSLMKETSETLIKVSDTLNFKFIVLMSMTFFGIGCLLLLLTLIVYYEYQKYRQTHSNDNIPFYKNAESNNTNALLKSDL